MDFDVFVRHNSESPKNLLFITYTRNLEPVSEVITFFLICDFDITS